MKISNRAFIFIPLLIIAGIGIACGFGFLIQFLWNSTISDIFDLKEITYWQGVMLLILFKILFSNDYTVNKSSSNGDKKTNSQWEIM